MTHESTIHLHHRLRVPLVYDVLCKAAERLRTRMMAFTAEETYLASPEWQD